MNKTAILIDSTFYMSQAELDQNNFYLVPLTVNFEHISYSEDATDPTQMVEVFNKINESKKLPRTSQPSTRDATRVFEQIQKDGYERVICLHLSSELSGTSQGMKVAADQYMEEVGDLAIEVYDTKAAAQVSAITAKLIAKSLKKYGSIEVSKIEEIIEYVSQKSEVFVFVDKLDYLSYGGRIPIAIASVGNLFGISPIIKLNAMGGLERYKAERSQKKAILSIIKLLEAKNYTAEDKLILTSFYTTTNKMSRKMIKECQKVTNATIVESEVSPMGIVISNHLGPNAFGIIWMPQYEI